MTTHNIGDTVRSSVDAQGLVRGCLYRVVDVRTVRRSFLGTFVSYSVVPLDRTVARLNPDGTTALISVGNGHLVLDGVSS